MESEVTAVKEATDRIEKKLDAVIENKAEKSELTATCATVSEHQTAIDKFKGSLIVVGAVGPIITGIVVALVTHWLFS